MREEWRPKRHASEICFSLGLLETNGIGTMIPVAHYDAGLGNPASIYTHPEHSSFAEYGGSNVHPDSHLDKIYCNIHARMSKHALETDKIHVMRFGIQVIAGAFDDFDVTDNATGRTIKQILGLQSEATHKQTYPNWSGSNLLNYGNKPHDLHADMPGLTTDQTIESVDFDIDEHYDTLHYSPIGEKYKRVQSGIKWYTLTRSRPFRDIKIHLKSSAKASNEYMCQAVRVILPRPNQSDEAIYQTCEESEASGASSPHLHIEAIGRMDEWHQNFTPDKVTA